MGEGADEEKRVEPVAPVEPKDLPVVDPKVTAKESVAKKPQGEKADAPDGQGEIKPEASLDRDKKELAESGKNSPDAVEVKKEELLKALEDQKEESAKILKEQKEVLQEMKEHVKQDKQADEIAALVDSVKQGIELQQVPQQAVNQQVQQQPINQQAPIQPLQQQQLLPVNQAQQQPKVYQPGQPVNR